MGTCSAGLSFAAVVAPGPGLRAVVPGGRVVVGAPVRWASRAASIRPRAAQQVAEEAVQIGQVTGGARAFQEAERADVAVLGVPGVLGASRVTSTAFAENAASRRVSESSTMRPVAYSGSPSTRWLRRCSETAFVDGFGRRLLINGLGNVEEK